MNQNDAWVFTVLILTIGAVVYSFIVRKWPLDKDQHDEPGDPIDAFNDRLDDHLGL